ncbi:MAG: NAD(P)-dependent oxidoreductase [Thermomicrobiales bacterium]
MSVDVLFAGSFFPEASRYLHEALPDATSAVADPADLSADLPGAPLLVPLMSRIDGAVMDRVEGLKLIHQWGAGIEGVDIAAATVRGIAVANIETGDSGNAASVSEWCVMAALALSRGLLGFKDEMATGRGWGYPVGRAMVGRKAGIVGFGGIGQLLAKRLLAFDMQVRVVTRSPEKHRDVLPGLTSIESDDALSNVLGEVDYLFLTLPLTSETRHLIDRAALAAMRPRAYLINAGRGGLVDSNALLAALDAGVISGAALDVFEHEPLDPASPLIMHPKTLVSPHIGGVTDRFFVHAAMQVIDALRRVKAGEPVPWALNADALAANAR